MRKRSTIAVVAILIAVAAVFGMSAFAAGPAGSQRSTVSYRETWRHGLDHWTAAGGTWRVRSGTLNFDGLHRSTIVAPFRVTSDRYAVQARIRLVHYRGNGVQVANSFGLLFRANARAGPGLGSGIFSTNSVGRNYTVAMVTAPADPAISDATGNYQEFYPGTAWHTYRIDVRSNHLRFLIDGRLRVDVDDSTASSDRSVGLFSTTSQIEVRSFEVVAL